MRIKRLRLRNIRSYVDAEIVFPEEGTMLLSGNIGSGKSSVLLAIDFALFGLQRGELSGNALLRNGSDSGKVELAMLIDNKEVIIKRSLKRSSSGVSQDSGSISVDGLEKQATAVELKQDVLDLLNYPSELLSKSKSLIFRYTVYTPQEEMKQILLGEADVRLNTLRRVFDIDKYKRIVENSKILSTHLRERKKEMLGRVADLPVKQQELVKRESDITRLYESLELLNPQVEELTSMLKAKESELKLVEESIAKVREHKQAFSQCDFELKQFIMQQERLSSEMVKLEQAIVSIVLPKIPDVSLLRSQIDEIEGLIAGHEVKSTEFTESLQDARTKYSISQSLVGKIANLSRCPTCMQDVSHEYKEGIVARENSNISSLNEHIVRVNDEFSRHCLELANLKAKRESLKRWVNDAELALLKAQSLNEKKMQLETMKKQALEIYEKISVLSIRKEELSKLVDDSHEGRLKTIKSEHQQLLVKEKELVARKASLDTSMKSTMEAIDSLRSEIDAKKRLSERMAFISGLKDWVEGSFVSMVESMERSVMMRVHGEFNSLFAKWFKVLVDSEDFSVRLDESFTPVIEQNGYDIEYLNLSGGEKTAAALAYRLALNQVTNSIVSAIKTKDLLILDEPTDGFSAEQLDHVRDVLEELKIGQVIIVSHEVKIESMVDKVIRFSKENHRTVVSR